MLTQVYIKGGAPLLVANVHLRARWSAAEKAVYFRKLLEIGVASGADLALVGDFNVTPDEEPIMEYRLRGEVDIHDTQEEIEEPTRKKADEPCGRHIGYMLSCGAIEVHTRRTVPIPFGDLLGSDHNMVAYEVGATQTQSVYRWPKKSRLRTEGAVTLRRCGKEKARTST